MSKLKEINTLDDLYHANPDVYKATTTKMIDNPKADVGLLFDNIKNEPTLFIDHRLDLKSDKAKLIRRHELTHYIRNTKNKTTARWATGDKPGVINKIKSALGTVVEEAAATNSMYKRDSGVRANKTLNKYLYPIEAGVQKVTEKPFRFNLLRTLIKKAEYAPGIPEKGSKTNLPTSHKLQEWEFVVQEHIANVRGKHYDLRLAPPGGVGFSWAINEIPTPGQRTDAIRTSDHTKDYFNFSGVIKSGYGAGTVKQIYRGKVDVIDAKPNKITFYWYGNSGTEVQKFTLINLYGDDKWVLLNHTKTITLDRQKNIEPLKYKDKSGSNFISKENDFETPKIDGASAIVILQGGKTPSVFSKRISKKSGLQIEYTPKIPKLLDNRPPDGLGLTVLRAEVFAIDPSGKEIPNSTLGGLLNSSVQKSRAVQKMSGTPLRLAGYDVVKYNGKKVDHLPIQDKYKILQELSSIYPVIENPLELQKTTPFLEGKIVWRDGVPIKVKNKKEYDVYVRDIYTNINGDRAGGIRYSHSPFGDIIANVGSGWTHKELKDMMNNPQNYIGRVAKITAQEKFKNGALRAPVFNGWHLEK